MRKLRVVSYVCVGTLLSVLLWHFICGCQAPVKGREEAVPAPTPLPAPETREDLIEEGIVIEEEAVPAVARPRPAAEAAPETVAAAPAPAPAPEERSYVVGKGDTLWGISRRFGVSLAELQAANGIADPGRLSVGQKLIVPGGN